MSELLFKNHRIVKGNPIDAFVEVAAGSFGWNGDYVGCIMREAGKAYFFESNRREASQPELRQIIKKMRQLEREAKL